MDSDQYFPIDTAMSESLEQVRQSVKTNMWELLDAGKQLQAGGFRDTRAKSGYPRSILVGGRIDMSLLDNEQPAPSAAVNGARSTQAGTQQPRKFQNNFDLNEETSEYMPLEDNILMSATSAAPTNTEVDLTNGIPRNLFYRH